MARPGLLLVDSRPGAANPAISHSSEQDQRLLTIFEIAKILATEHDLSRMLPRFLDRLLDTFEAADAGVLFLYDAGDGWLKVAAAQGYDLQKLRSLRLAPGESMSGSVFATGQAQLYTSPEATARAMASLSPCNRAAFTEATTGIGQPLSAICMPLATGAEQRAGVLVLENLRQPASFNEDDLVFLRHVTDLITLSIDNAALKQQLQAAQAVGETNRLKAEVISTLAHEMRTPLTSIKGYSSALLMEDVSFSEETQREFLQMIDEECDTLQDLIHDLLESSIIEAGLLKLEAEPVLMPRLARSVVDDVAHRTGNHRFLVDFPAAFPLLEADSHRIVQVLRNLVDNAVKYSPAGGLIVVRGQVRGRDAVISVADQGEGIAPEHLNRLFEKYFRVKSGSGRHVVGVGLGLPIAHNIIENHGGRIWAESQLGQGTTLYFTLPLPNPDTGAANGESQSHEP